MKKIIKFSILIIGIIISSCSLDLLDNPNAVTTKNTDLNFLLNNIQLTFNASFGGSTSIGSTGGFNDIGLRLTRQLNQGAVIYDNAVSPGGVNNLWDQTYAKALADINTLLPLAEKQEFWLHTAMSRIMRSYLLTLLVDHFGDVPYSKALNAEDFNPAVDKGADVYEAALADLNKAIEDLGKTAKGTANDFFYKSDKTKWLRLANTLKLRLLLNRRLADPGAATAINAVIATKNLIENSSQSFLFKYGSNLANPDSRHPRYGAQYLTTGGGDYQSNQYMRMFIDSKGFPDPRLRYYFYRQVLVDTKDPNDLRCLNANKPRHYPDDMVYCLPISSMSGLNFGYWGRDHLNNEGIPPDGVKRTAWGVYPVGGSYDADNGKGVTQGGGAGGAGIQPIIMSSYVDFMLAEAALVLKTTGDPKALLESGVRKSLNEVREISLATSQGAAINTFESSKGYVYKDEIEKYVTKVKALYDAATSDDGRLDVIMREYWLAGHGNGVEAYNGLRRTGKPSGLQPALDPNPGTFVWSCYYPLAYIQRNSTAVQKTTATVKVFWDKNPQDFVK